MMAESELLHIFPGLPLGYAINTVCSLPRIGIPLSLILLFFFIWSPSGVVVWLAVVVAVVAVVAALLVLRALVVVGRRRRLPLLLWRRVFGAMISFCVLLARPLLGFLFRSRLPPFFLSLT